jgi:enoyl-CoA hydratase/carnithine racemase
VLRVETRGTVRVLTLDRADRRNAISRALAAALGIELARTSDDEAVAAVVLAAEGAVWAAGGDLDELQALGFEPEAAEAVLELGALASALEDCAVPVIAAVQGPALGGGAELLVACDLAVMEVDASLAFLHAKMGLVPAWGGASRLVERVGASRAADLLFSARAVSAAEALALGLAARVVPAGRAGVEALALAETMSAHGRAALARMKRTLNAVRRARRGSGLADERQVFREAWGEAPHRAAFGRRG